MPLRFTQENLDMNHKILNNVVEEVVTIVLIGLHANRNASKAHYEYQQALIRAKQW